MIIFKPTQNCLTRRESLPDGGYQTYALSWHSFFCLLLLFFSYLKFPKIKFQYFLLECPVK